MKILNILGRIENFLQKKKFMFTLGSYIIKPGENCVVFVFLASNLLCFDALVKDFRTVFVLLLWTTKGCLIVEYGGKKYP